MFVGRKFQRGHGLGSILGGFFRRLVLPFLKTNAKSMLRNVAKTGVGVASDVIDGQSFANSVKIRVPAGIKRGVEDIMFQSAPAKRQSAPTSRHPRHRHPRRRRRRDIFT